MNEQHRLITTMREEMARERRLTLDSENRLWCSCGDEITYDSQDTCDHCRIIQCEACIWSLDRNEVHLCRRCYVIELEKRYLARLCEGNNHEEE